MPSSMQTTTNAPTSDADKLQLANTLLTSLKTKNWDLFGSIITENTTWSLPGTSYISGLATGADAVIERAQRIVSFGVNFNLSHVLYGQNGVALSLHNQTIRGTKVLDEYLATVCEIRNGKIVAINTYLSDVPMVNAFFTQ
jgi:ketosteroid isomerase-like protein